MLVQTTDFFYPNIDDPYLQGKITCANVLSDLYAMGVSHCDNMLMLLSLSRNMTVEQRGIITPMLIKGFNDLAKEAGCLVTGGQTVMNPWCIIGGVASAVVSKDEIIMPVKAVAGDVIVLTKPLGTQVAVNAFQWLHQPAKLERVKDLITREQILRAYRTACISMSRLNKVGAELMMKYKAHAATDVTGFGLMGHAQNLCGNQNDLVDFEFHSLPLIRDMFTVNQKVNFRLHQGYSSETSGGLLICLPADQAELFIEEIQKREGFPAWIIGRVLPGTRQARLVENPTIIEVADQDPPPKID